MSPNCPALDRDGVHAEFVDTLSRCAECGSPLAEGPRPNAPIGSRADYVNMVTVYVSTDAPSAYLLRGLLEAEGIPTLVLGEPLGGAIGELPVTVLQLPIQVPEEFATRAREVASEFESAGRTAV